MNEILMRRVFLGISCRLTANTQCVLHGIRICISFVAISSVVGLLGCSKSEDTIPKHVVAVKVARAERFDVSLTIRVPATLFPREQANLAPRTASPIRELRARKGDNVTAGQVLVVLENHDLQAQQREAQAAVMEAQANLEKISSGTLVTDVEKARGQVAIAEAALNQAQKNYDRRAELFSQGAIAQRDLLFSQTELAQAKTAFDVSTKTLELLEHQSGGRDIRQAESHLAQIKARLQLIEAQLQLAELRSPFAGSITEQFLYPGDMAKPETPIFTVMDLSTVIARAQVPEEQTGSIQLGQKGFFTPSGKDQIHFEGRISLVNKAVDPVRRAVEVWCEIPNHSHQLRAGEFGTLSIITGVAAQSVVVPLAGIQFIGGSHEGWVMVVDEKHTAHKVEIKVGEIFDGKTQITQGLKGKELIVVEGGYGLLEGTEVTFTENQ
jgi:multidrug efflux pump subunit AcrA (membrane-fusion protein)